MKGIDCIVETRLSDHAEVIETYNVHQCHAHWLFITAWLTPDDDKVWFKVEQRHGSKPDTSRYPRILKAKRVGSALLKYGGTTSKGKHKGKNIYYQHKRRWKCLWTEGQVFELDMLVGALTAEVQEFESHSTPMSRELSAKLSGVLKGM